MNKKLPLGLLFLTAPVLAKHVTIERSIEITGELPADEASLDFAKAQAAALRTEVEHAQAEEAARQEAAALRAKAEQAQAEEVAKAEADALRAEAEGAEAEAADKARTFVADVKEAATRLSEAVRSTARSQYEAAQDAYDEAVRAGHGAAEDLAQAASVAKENYVSAANQALAYLEGKYESIADVAARAGSAVSAEAKLVYEAAANEAEAVYKRAQAEYAELVG